MHPDRIKLILKIVAPVTLTSLFFLTLVFQFTSSVEAAGIIFVDALVSGGSDDGSDWANAYIDLQSALAVATSGDEIWVATGVYTPGTSATDTFQLLDGVAIYGGFAATETARSQRDWEANLTVLSGDIDSDDTADSNGIVTDTANITGTNTYHIVTGDGVTTTAVLDGFTITAGNALGVNCSNNGCGGGMYNSDGSPSLTNLIFSANHAQFWGGGIYNESSYSTFTNVTFYANSTEEDSGGGMHNSSGLVTLNQVVFNNNSAGWNGGGAMFNGGTDAILNNVAFIGNSVPGDGGAILNSSSDIIMTNVMFSANSAQNGGGIFNVSSHPTLLNVTFSGNSATGRGGGMDSILGSRPAITNTIFWGNDAPENPNMRSASGSVPTVSYSLIEGSGGSSSWDSSFGTDAGNNIDSDPFFTFSIIASQSPTLTANLQLMIDSPAINSGRDASYNGLYDTDLAGNNRVENETIDMGAYETLFASLLVTNAGSGEGRVSSDSADINCGITCTVRAELDTTITLTAATETGSTFSGWSGSVSSLSNPIALTLEAAESVTATFTLETNAVAVVNNGTGNGRVASDPAGIDCGSSCTYEFDYNSVVTLTAAADNDSTFTGWSGSCSGTDSICVVTIDAVKAAVAEFTLNQYALTTAAAGTGSGTISRSMDADLYDHGTVVTLTATADDGSTFVGWSGDCSGSDDCPITLDEAQTVTATFDDIAEPVFPNEPLNEPTDGSQLKTTRPTFDWDAASDNQTGVISYTLVLTQTEATRSAENTVFTFETRETSLTVDFDLTAGEYTWAVHALDEAGNISAQTDTFSFTIDIDESDDDDTADGLHRLYLPVITRP